MSIAKESLRPRSSRPLPYPLASYYERYADLSDEPEIEPSKVLRLPAVTVATLRYTAPDVNDLQITTRGLATEASILLAAWRARSDLTGWRTAEELQERYFGGRTRGFTRGLEPYRNVPRKGFDLLVAIDALGYVEWFADVPADDDWRRFESVRLGVALARLTSRQRTEGAAR